MTAIAFAIAIANAVIVAGGVARYTIVFRREKPAPGSARTPLAVALPLVLVACCALLQVAVAGTITWVAALMMVMNLATLIFSRPDPEGWRSLAALQAEQDQRVRARALAR